MTPNERAFLEVIGFSEGTTRIPDSDNGYKVIVGSTPSNPDLMTGYADHPRKYVYLPSFHIESSAAGKFQILARYFDIYKKTLKLPDFSPESQDKIALKLIDECHARDDINRGLFSEAIHKCRRRWASFPGADYGQHEKNMSDLMACFVEHGGSLA